MILILQTIIAVVAILILFSIANSLIIEGIGRLVKRRANELVESIKDLLGSDRTNENALGDKFFKHAFIKTLGEAEGKNRKPTRIAADVFAETFIDLLISEGKTGDKDPMDIDEVLKSFQNGISELPKNLQPALKQLMRYTKGHANEQLDVLKTKITGWFEVYMERLREKYRRRSRVYLFISGILLAGLLNLDLVYLTHALTQNEDLRLNYYSLGKEISNNDISIDTTKILEYISNNLQQLNANDLIKEVAKNMSVKGDSTHVAVVTVPEPLPIGWVNGASKLYGGFSGAPIESYIWKFIGIILFAAGLSFGAPFWFDFLRKVTGLDKML